MRFYILSICMLCFSFVAFSQQEAQYTQFMHNKLYYNPAYSGSKEVLSFSALYRNQWLGFKNAPKSFQVNFDTPIFGNRVGLGINLSQLNIAFFKTTTITMSYSYTLINSKEGVLRLGVSGTLKNSNIDFADPDIFLTDQGDPSVLIGKEKQLKGNFGLGMYYNTDNYYIGLSAPKLYSNLIGFNNGNITAKESQHFYFMAGFIKPINKTIEIKPELLVKYVKNAPIDFDLHASLIFNKKISTGVTYRTGGDNFGSSFDLLGLYKVTDQFSLGFAYDLVLSKFKSKNAGSLEFLVRYENIKSQKNLSNPRFFF